MAADASGAAGLARRCQDLVLPIAMITSVLVILVPLPPALLDVLLAGNITVSVIVLLTTVYVKSPLEFSIFPSLLLATTLARLVLNVATTRLILTRAAVDGENAAGGVITAFANFVAGDGNIVVGLIIFIIIVVIQFVVITKGATRISEVAARFSLDGMPGKQMAIDADLNAGIIDEHEAQSRRNEITQQADFYGAMDGASKFVRGDAVAGIIITVINVLGGLIIGVAEHGMPLMEAGSLFTRLTIGDGLVSQVPAFLISLAAALLITRSTRSSNLPHEFMQQLFARPQALAVAAGFLAVLVMTDLPRTPLMVMCAACLGVARMLTQAESQKKTRDATEAKEQKKPAEERIEDFLAIDPMEVEVGVGLIRLADPKRGGDLLERIQRVRQGVASEIGVIMPKIRIRDNMRLDPNEYRIKIADMPIAQDRLEPGYLLAIDSGMTTGKIDGIDTKDPAFGTDAKWIQPALQDNAELLGYTVVEPGAVLATHLTEVCRRHADEILTRDAAKHLVSELKQSQPAVVEELIPGAMSLAEVQGVLQLLLREQVPIRQLALILETLGDYAGRTKDPILLTEYVRHRLARQICTRYRNEQGELYVIALDPAMEDRIRAGFEHNERGLFIRMSPQAIEATCSSIAEQLSKLTTANHTPIVLVSPQIRAALKQITENHLSQLVVLSFNEITRDTQIVTLGLASDG
ncbi:flagellar biosynthesis protein FlhA [Bythopirellula polymerisocia]|uniref:Flagellar biosynthesis protein FlhA n=1 Tax=Bythopirellula polymerisocia TaxID=2528003 RepID=A0A5C6CTQ7_9BACT|nr:flagellar biosynthesis protein FlhA [Bythopirellula polymerisocia]TWU27788.1 Flagellar biosynthesis protein FlhA [Bythopirellula polymerisocia]